jgi:hypothetical protein
MKTSIICLIAMFLTLIAPKNSAHSVDLQMGSYFTERQDVVETETEVRFTEEIIQLTPSEKKCSYIKVRILETKGRIPYLRRDPAAQLIEYSGNYDIEKNVLVLNLSTRESGESEGAGDVPRIMKLMILNQSLVEVGSNKTFRFAKK